MEDRPDRRVELRVHRDEVLSVGERLESDPRAELDRARHIHDRVDVLRVAEKQGVLGHRRAAGAHGVLESAQVVDDDAVLGARVAEDLDRLVRLAPVDRHDLHSRHAVPDLVGQALCHEPCPEKAHPDGPAVRFPGAQRIVDDDHRQALAGSRSGASAIRRRSSGSTSARRGQDASLSDISVTGRGHVRSRSGSSYRRPPSASGV